MNLSMIGTFLIFCVWKIQAQDIPLIIDGHNDLAGNLYTLLKNDITNFKFDQDLSEDEIWGKCSSCFTDIPKLKQGRVGAQFWSAYVSCGIQYKDALGKTLDQIDVIKRLVNKFPEHLTFVTSADGILQAFDDGKIGSLIGVEGGHSMDSRLAVLRMYYELGVRYMTLTHTCNTPCTKITITLQVMWLLLIRADGSPVDNATPVLNLTSWGQEVVLEMNRIGMMIDLSHVSHNVMNHALQLSRAPAIFSHSSAYTVRPHHRNVRDDTLELVKSSGSLVMVNFYSGFVSMNPESATIRDVVDHINYIADKIGADYVGIGGDYDGVDRQPTGLENVSKYPDLLNLLKELRPDIWTTENLEKLAHKNLIRVFRAVEAARDNLVSELPRQMWIPEDDLYEVPLDQKLWECRTLLDNSSPDRDGSNGSNTSNKGGPLAIFIFTIIYILQRFI